MFTLIRKLYHTRLLTIVGLLRLLEAILTTGVNLMALLRIAAKLHPGRVAVVDDREQLSYTQLWEQAESLAMALHMDFGVRSQQKVAIACRSHAAAIKAIFAVSRLGAHVFLLNPEMSADQILALEERLRFDFVVYDEQIAHVFENSSLREQSLPAYHPTDNSIDRLSSGSRPGKVRLKKVQTGNIVVLTGGTTGRPKSASRKPSIFNFLPPFFAFLTQVHLDRYQSVYIATPICHGYGVAFLFIGVILGAEMHFTERFDAGRACSLIAAHRIQVVTVVPLMLQRMLNLDPGSLSSLQCIITGSALLNPALAEETLKQLGPILFNLYGTSEAGFCIIGTPDVIGRKPDSIGKPMQGVRAKIVNDSGQEVGAGLIGRLCIRSAWTTNRESWMETGDLAYRDSEGDIFLCGRVDDMIVSGGENVYPIELENVLAQHPDVDSAVVFGIPDKEFGQRLKAVVIKKRGTDLDQSTLLDWLKPRVARYQMPAIIDFRDEIPYTSLGKLDKKSLWG
jgi:acyl-CoA synthetase (AMP-forming)/AMP-acid ligase II